MCSRQCLLAELGGTCAPVVIVVVDVDDWGVLFARSRDQRLHDGQHLLDGVPQRVGVVVLVAVEHVDDD